MNSRSGAALTSAECGSGQRHALAKAVPFASPAIKWAYIVRSRLLSFFARVQEPLISTRALSRNLPLQIYRYGMPTRTWTLQQAP